MLSALGLSPLEEAIYDVLLKGPVRSAGALAAAVGTNRSAAKRALLRLGELGLVRTGADGRTPTYEPADPGTAISALIRRRQTELDELHSVGQRLAETFHQASVRDGRAPIVEVISGQAVLRERATALDSNLTAEKLAFDVPPYVVDVFTYPEVETERRSLERHVRRKVIYSRQALEIADRFSRVAALVELGEEARVLPELPMKLAIFDRHTAILPLSSDTDASQTSVIVRRSTLLDALIMFFELMWQRATPIRDGVGTEPARGDDLSTIIAMLAAGLTDQAIMRQLDISTRTMRRRMASIYERLNAGTRFQAGYNAAASDSGRFSRSLWLAAPR